MRFWYALREEERDRKRSKDGGEGERGGREGGTHFLPR